MNFETARMIMAVPDSLRPGWFLAEAARDLPRLARQGDGA
jgi:hypothetical protein